MLGIDEQMEGEEFMKYLRLVDANYGDPPYAKLEYN